VLHRIPGQEGRVAVQYRPSGDRYLLVEYGPPVLDLNLRFRVHALMEHLRLARLPGVIDLTPGIRSLQVHFDDRRLTADSLLRELVDAESELPAIDDIEVPTRIVHLPLSWDDPATQLAIARYTQGVRKDAPWCPSNIDFIRRVNGLDTIDEVREIVFGASYLVLGLGDVYLGAPVATPLDPRHRLVTTKYNPARTWTPENAVGIGGAYLCVYGMEGPGGYQFVGRTVQMWNPYRQTADFEEGKPWLLRFFDQIRFHPVSAGELLRFREAFLLGRARLEIEEETFRLGEFNQFLSRNRAEIAVFKARQQAAFERERRHWKLLEASETSLEQEMVAVEASARELPPHSEAVSSHVSGSVWRIVVVDGVCVAEGDVLVIVESMKMEIEIRAPFAGEVVEVRCGEGRAVAAGDVLVALRR
jgi:urea carboxylase